MPVNSFLDNYRKKNIGKGAWKIISPIQEMSASKQDYNMAVFLDSLLFYHGRHLVDLMRIPSSALEMLSQSLKEKLCCVVFQEHKGTVTQKFQRKRGFQRSFFLVKGAGCMTAVCNFNLKKLSRILALSMSLINVIGLRFCFITVEQSRMS